MKLSTSLAVLAITGTTVADLQGFDISQAQSSSFWSCMRNDGYHKVNIRAYFQSCGSKGGAVDPNFMKSYNAARNAGFKAPSEIDAYMFPCTGTQEHAKCKSPAAQIDELLDMFKANNVKVHRIWLDVEPGNSECNAWNLSKEKNLQLAKQWTSELRKTGLKWGVYANGNEWTRMFPSRSSDIDDSLPLIAVMADGKPGVSTVPESRLMGGWKTNKVIGKQYKLDTKVCGGNVDLDSFSE